MPRIKLVPSRQRPDQQPGADAGMVHQGPPPVSANLGGVYHPLGMADAQGNQMELSSTS